MIKKVVDIQYAKSKGYKQVIGKIARQGLCPFCPENFVYHKHPILRRSGSWFITRSSWAYPKSQLHFVIICIKHKENISELKNTDLTSIFRLISWAVTKFKIPGGGFAMRFGETSYTGATVCHLHCHLIVPQLDGRTKRAKTVSFPIG